MQLASVIMVAAQCSSGSGAEVYEHAILFTGFWRTLLPDTVHGVVS
jgi:hypothetical protein